jgi:hypothetical protein
MSKVGADNDVGALGGYLSGALRGGGMGSSPAYEAHLSWKRHRAGWASGFVHQLENQAGNVVCRACDAVGRRARKLLQDRIVEVTLTDRPALLRQGRYVQAFASFGPYCPDDHTDRPALRQRHHAPIVYPKSAHFVRTNTDLLSPAGGHALGPHAPEGIRVRGRRAGQRGLLREPAAGDGSGGAEGNRRGYGLRGPLHAPPREAKAHARAGEGHETLRGGPDPTQNQLFATIPPLAQHVSTCKRPRQVAS